MYILASKQAYIYIVGNLFFTFLPGQPDKIWTVNLHDSHDSFEPRKRLMSDCGAGFTLNPV